MLGERGTLGVGLCAGAGDHGAQANLGRDTTGCKPSARIRKASECVGSEAVAPLDKKLNSSILEKVAPQVNRRSFIRSRAEVLSSGPTRQAAKHGTTSTEPKVHGVDVNKVRSLNVEPKALDVSCPKPYSLIRTRTDSFACGVGDGGENGSGASQGSTAKARRIHDECNNVSGSGKSFIPYHKSAVLKRKFCPHIHSANGSHNLNKGRSASGGGHPKDPTRAQRLPKECMQETLNTASSGSAKNPAEVTEHTACENIGCYYCELFGYNMEG